MPSSRRHGSVGAAATFLSPVSSWCCWQLPSGDTFSLGRATLDRFQRSPSGRSTRRDLLSAGRRSLDAVSWLLYPGEPFWVLDGSTKSLRRILTPGLVPVDPSFSPDGKWLAFVASKEISSDYSGDVVSTVLSSTLWFARANGTNAHPVVQIPPNSNAPNNSTFGWNPHLDLFASSFGTAKFGRRPAMGVDLVSPTGSIRQVVGNTHVVSAVWSPDGSAIAVSTEAGSEPTGPPIDGTLASYPVNGGSPTTWLSQAGFIVTAGWWSVWGIGYTTVGSGAVPGGSATADGSPMYAIRRPGTTPVQLGMTLQTEGTGVPSATSTGWLAFVQDDQNGGGRVVWQGKQVVVCSPVTAECSAIPHPAGTVTGDPVWTPTGSALAYVQGSALPEGFLPQTVADWYNAHQLYLYDPTTGASVVAPQTDGVTVPLWSTNGQSLLYVSNDGLWLHPTLTQPPVEIAQPIFAGDWLASTFYGQVPFSSQFGWSSIQHVAPSEGPS